MKQSLFFLSVGLIAHVAVGGEFGLSNQSIAPRSTLKNPPYRIMGFPNYAKIGHLPGSKMGEGDRLIDRGAANLCLSEPRPWHFVIVQEKLDGANVGVFLDQKGHLIALSREGYACATSPYPHFRQFVQWVKQNEPRFKAVLNPGERLCGEWLTKTHGIRY